VAEFLKERKKKHIKSGFLENIAIASVQIEWRKRKRGRKGN
jgi:hypothetical protein